VERKEGEVETRWRRSERRKGVRRGEGWKSKEREERRRTVA